VPDSCIVHDFNNTKSGSVYAERERGISILAQICPQKQALTAIEGVVYNCKQSDTNVYVIRYLNLGDKPEFADIGNPGNIISDDFLTFPIGKHQDGNYSNIKVGSSSDIRIKVTSLDNPHTTIRMVPAKQVEITYNGRFAPAETRGYYFLTIVPDLVKAGERQMMTGNTIAYEDIATTTTTPSGVLPAPVQQIFDSFELLQPSSSSPSRPTASSPLQEEERQQSRSTISTS
jgi:hypothetical protein